MWTAGAMKACKKKLTTAACHLCSVGKEVSKCSQRRMAIVGILIGLASLFSNAYRGAKGWSERFLQLSLSTHNGQKYYKIDVVDQYTTLYQNRVGAVYSTLRLIA